MITEIKNIMFCLMVAAAAAGCSQAKNPLDSSLHSFAPGPPVDAELCKRLELDAAAIEAIEAKPLFQCSEEEVGKFIRYVHEAEPDLSRRVVRIGRKNIGQPYEIYLLGEFPFETYDAQPLYCLTKSDCVVFSEHTYAMSLGKDWSSFFRLLQRIRYKNGQIGYLTRNHYTESDWDRNNSWLVRDVTDEIAGDLVKPFAEKINRAKFFKKYGIGQDIPVEEFKTTYIPYEAFEKVAGKLQNGDFVNIVYSSSPGDSQWVSHTGLIAVAEDGTRDFLHSSPPKVREEPMTAYIGRRIVDNEKKRADKKPTFVGFKFLRLEKDPLANLQALDGPDAPRFSPPPLPGFPAAKP